MMNRFATFSVVLLLLLQINKSNGESFTSIVEKRTKRNNKNIKTVVHPPNAYGKNKEHFLQPSTGIKSHTYDINVGSFRIVYTAPNALEPSYDESSEAFDLTYNYVTDNLYPLGFNGGSSIGYGFSYESEPGSDPKLIIEVLNFVLSFYDDGTTAVTPTGIFEVITSIISNNKVYLDIITGLTGTPFELVTVVEIDNYREGTLYPTFAPYPTPTPIPYPTPSPVPVLPAVYVPLGDVSILYTSPGASEPSDDTFYDIMVYTYTYLIDVVRYAFSDLFYADFFINGGDYNYIDPVATPNIITIFENMTVSFTEYRRAIPTVNEIESILSESLNATYVDIINTIFGGFGTVTDVTMEFDSNIPTASPTKLENLLTEAPVPKSRRKHRKPT